MSQRKHGTLYYNKKIVIRERFEIIPKGKNA